MPWKPINVIQNVTSSHWIKLPHFFRSILQSSENSQNYALSIALTACYRQKEITTGSRYK